MVSTNINTLVFFHLSFKCNFDSQKKINVTFFFGWANHRENKILGKKKVIIKEEAKKKKTIIDQENFIY